MSLRGLSIVLAVLWPLMADAQGRAVPEGPLPNEEGAMLGMFAQMEACAEVSPELKPLHQAWLGDNGLQSMNAEAHLDERFAPMKKAIAAHWAAAGKPKDELAAACRDDLTLYKRHR